MESIIERIERDYGSEFVADMRQLMQAETSGLQNQLANTERQGRRDRVMVAMDADRVLGSLWRDVNQEQGFIDWLGQIDPLFGIPRMTALQRAFDAGDAGPVRALFAQYLVDQKRIPAEAAPAPTPRQPWMPSSAPSTATVPADQQPRQWTRAQIARFYEACRRGDYDKRPDERRRLETDILRAGQEGRIVDPPIDPNAVLLTAPRPAAPRRFRYRPVG